MKKIILISALILLVMPFIMAERPSDVNLEKTTHLLAVKTFERFSYFPLETIKKSLGGIPEIKNAIDRSEYESANYVLLAAVGYRCWQCRCMYCGWQGRIYGCAPWYGGDPCGGSRCPIHGPSLRTVSWPCSTIDMDCVH